MNDLDIKRFRDEWLVREQQTLNEKTDRWKQIQPAAYGRLPTLMWEYLNYVDEMFIDGYFLGTILLCAAITELVLFDQLILNTQITEDEVEHFSLEQMAILTHRLGIITETEKSVIDELRKLRNPLIHANVGKISKMAKKRLGEDSQGMETIFYISSFTDDGGISADALKYLRFTSDLTVKFYGSKTD